MLDYTKSTALDTLDLVKKILLVLDLLIQVFYIGYLAFIIYMQYKIPIINIILISISTIYLMYYLFNIREFYTKKHLQQKKIFKTCVKVSKRLINLVTIAIAVSALAANQNLANMDLLFTLLLIVGFILAVFADIVVALVDQRKNLFINAISQDVKDFEENNEMQISLLRTLLKIEIRKEALYVEPKQLHKLKKIKYKCEQKKRRKDDFHHKLKN